MAACHCSLRWHSAFHNGGLASCLVGEEESWSWTTDGLFIRGSKLWVTAVFFTIDQATAFGVRIILQAIQSNFQPVFIRWAT